MNKAKGGLHMFDFAAIPAIVAICYFTAEVYKVFAAEDKYKHIPVLCAALGGILGAICFVAITDFIPADNIVNAVAIGLASGWAATGVNQTIKQEKEE